MSRLVDLAQSTLAHSVLAQSTMARSTPTPLYPPDADAVSPVPLWLGVLFGVAVVVASFVVLLPSVRHRLDRISSRRPRRFRQ